MKDKNSRRAKLGWRTIVYRRTSTRQITTNTTGGLEPQRRLRDGLLHHGWPPGAIRVIDEDAGLSAGPGSKRAGWRRLLRLVAKRQVGVIAVSNLSRLRRSLAEFAAFLRLCLKTGTRLVVGGKTVKPFDFTDN